MKKIVALVLAMVMVLGLATTAFAFEDAVKTYGGKYAEATDKLAATYTDVTVEYYAAEAPEYNKDKTELKEPGVVAHYVVYEGDVMVGYFIKANTVNDADLVIYNDAAMKKTFLNLDAIDSPLYLGVGVAFENFGDECGQVDVTPVKGVKYYTLDGAYYATVKNYAGIQLMVDNKLVAVEVKDFDTVEHSAAYTIEDGKVIAVECSECGEPAVYAANWKSVPKFVQSVGNDVDGYWYWPAKAAAPAGDDTTVESPKTFDAGIAMYVGMSVMAAAGSAVVLKKKD